MPEDTSPNPAMRSFHQLEHAATLLSHARNPSHALERILKLVSETLAACGSVIVLTDTAPKMLQGCSWGKFQTPLAQVARELRAGLGNQATATAQQTVLPGVSTTPVPEGMLLTVPIRAGQQTLGGMVIFCPDQSSHWLDTALPFCNIAATCLALYLQHAELQVQIKSLEQSRRSAEMGRSANYNPDRIIGDSPPIVAVLQQVEQAAASRSTVLLRGESGTGKELVARALHKLSDRRQHPFVQLNCAALPESLLESELFGHERGAFTGAVKMRRGRFEMADKGTLFLDEIGDISPATQVKLLRVLQERTFERVGGNRTITVDTRIIAATNIDLEAAVRAGRFREDLYYRLNVVPIVLPPLRQRQEDIPLLVGYFLHRFNAENRKNLKISSSAMDLIVGYDWPGNVRELENCVERMVVMARRDIIAPEDVPLPEDVLRVPALSTPTVVSAADDHSLSRTIAELEHHRLIEALQRTGGVQTRAAALLGITPRQLGYKLKKYRIDPKRLITW
jgi:Nif-specific regulatory protein